MNDSYFVVKKNDIPRFVLQLFMASHWGILKGYSFNSPIWSISAEVLVYFFFYIILRRFGPRLLINLVIILACATAKLLGMGSPVFDCFVFFYAGGIAATISRNPILGNKRKLCGGVLLISLATACWLSISLELYAWRYFHYFFLVVCVPPFLYLLCENIRIPNSARTLIEAAGNMTYSSYLIHFPLQLGVALTYSSLGIKIPMYHPAFFLAFIGSTLSLSFLIYRYFEAPAQRMIRKRMLLASTDRRSAEKRATSP